MGYGSERDSFATLVSHSRTGHRMASRCGEPGALLLFTFIGQSRFDEIGCRARRSASPSDCRRPRLYCPSDPVVFLQHPDLHLNELGARGIGEIGLAGIAAAITSAIHHATGVRVRELPVRIEDLLASQVI